MGIGVISHTNLKGNIYTLVLVFQMRHKFGHKLTSFERLKITSFFWFVIDYNYFSIIANFLPLLDTTSSRGTDLHRFKFAFCHWLVFIFGLFLDIALESCNIRALLTGGVAFCYINTFLTIGDIFVS